MKGQNQAQQGLEIQHHNTKILITYGSSHDPPQGVPGTVVKPVQEVVEPILGHVVGSTIIEPSEAKKIMSRQTWSGNRPD